MRMSLTGYLQVENKGEVAKLTEHIRATERKIQEESVLPSDHKTPQLAEKVTDSERQLQAY